MPMNDDLNILYDLQKEFDAFSARVKEVQKVLTYSDLKEFIIALEDVYTDEFLPVLTFCQKGKEGNFEKQKRRLLREYHDNLL